MNGAPPSTSGSAAPASLPHRRAPQLNTHPANREFIKRRCERLEAGSIARARARGVQRFECASILTREGRQRRCCSPSNRRITKLAAGIAAAATRCFSNSLTAKLKWLRAAGPRKKITAVEVVLEKPGSCGCHARCRAPMGGAGTSRETLGQNLARMALRKRLGSQAGP